MVNSHADRWLSHEMLTASGRPQLPAPLDVGTAGGELGDAVGAAVEATGGAEWVAPGFDAEQPSPDATSSTATHPVRRRRQNTAITSPARLVRM